MATAKKPAKEQIQKAAEVAIERGLVAADFRPIDQLIPYARNAKKHPPAQVANLAALITEFGWTNPVLADAKGIVAGHGRVMAARKLYESGATIRLPNGVEIPQGTVPVLDCTGWDENKRRFYIIADNQSAESEWDEDILKLELSDFATMDFDLDLLGFDPDELKRLQGTTVHFGNTDADEELEPPTEAVTRLGDVWIMDGHRIICGDSTNAEAVAKVLNGAKPQLMVTDPPYGVAYDPTWRDDKGSFGMTVMRGKVENDDKADWTETWAHFPGDVAYVWHGALHAGVVAASLETAGLAVRAQIVWKKQHFAMSRGDYHWMHEPCWYVVRPGAKSHWNGDRTQHTVWEIASLNPAGHSRKIEDEKSGHGTQKPVECMRRPIANNSAVGDAIYEPFSGSGSTIIAGEMSKRRVYAVELNPAYVDLAVERWQRFAGKTAVLEGDGRSFAEVMAERTPDRKPAEAKAETPAPAKKAARPRKPANTPAA